MELAKELVDLLIEKEWRITFAESCTGGMAASALVDVPDASKVFDGSFVTYANVLKMELLDVFGETISENGVVSEPVAVQMAVGAAERTGAQVSVGISGIAGPGGGSAEKPVGTVCFGFLVGEELFSATCRFGDSGRKQVREAAVRFAYETVINKIKNECL